MYAKFNCIVLLCLTCFCLPVMGETPEKSDCVRYNWTELSKKLTDQTVSPSWEDECDSIITLHMSFGSESVALNFLQRELKSNIPTSKLQLLLMFSVSGNYQQITRELLKFGISPNSSKGLNGSLLIDAAKEEHLEIMRMLIEAGAEVNYETEDGVNALIVAARNGKGYAFNLLLDFHADINKYKNIDYSGFLLNQAILGKNVKIVIAVAKNDFNLNSRNKVGFSPLMFAINGAASRKMIETLLNLGANPCLKNPTGENASEMYRRLEKEFKLKIRDYEGLFNKACH